MKTILVILVLIFSANLSYTQVSIKPGIFAGYSRQSHLFGYVISNDLFYQKGKNSFVFGFDFFNAFGNKNIQWKNSEFKYSFVGFNYTPADHISSSSVISFPKQIAKPFTSSSRHITLRIEYNRILNIYNFRFQTGFGIFGSHVDTYYYLEGFENSVLFLYNTQTKVLENVNIVLPVFLRYYNFGSTVYFNIPLFESKRYPLDFTMRYYLGMHRTRVFSLGLSKKLTPKSKK